MTLKFRLFLVLLGIVLLGAALNLGHQVLSTRQYLQVQLQQHAQDAANHVGMWIQAPLAEQDYSLVETKLNAFFDSSYFLAARLQRVTGETLFDYRSSARFDTTPAWFVDLLPLKTGVGISEISNGWQQFAVLEVTSHPGIAYQYLWESAKSTATMSMGIAFVALGLGLYLLRIVMRPLEAITRQAMALRLGRYEPIKKRPDTKELATVVDALNKMVETVGENFSRLHADLDASRTELLHDSETGLDNRKAFLLELEQALADDQSPDGALAVVRLTSLDSLRQHQGGDAVMRELSLVSQWLSDLTLRMGGRAFRFNLGEFVVQFPSQDLQTLQRFSDALLGMAQGHQHDLHEQGVLAIGATLFHSGEPVSTVLSRADAGTTRAEQEQGFWLQQAEVVGTVAERRQQIEQLLSAEGFSLLKQPLYAPTSGEIMMSEVLIKSISDSLSTADFISEIHRFGAAQRLDMRVLEQVFAYLSASSDGSVLAVNLTSASIHDPGFLNWLQPQLKYYRPHLKRLVLEIGEQSVLSHEQQAALLIGTVQKFGVRVTIEKVGVGAHFTYLKNLGPDHIKIDGRYLRGLDDEKWPLIKALVQLGHSLGITVFAEQVEQQSEREQLAELGIDGMQGYLLSRPRAL